MPGLSFIYPEMLWLLALLGGLWGLGLTLPLRLSPARHYASLGLRSVIVGCLVLAVAGVQLRRPSEALTTVFLLDGSDSITPSARRQAETLIDEAVAAMRPEQRAAVVIFGANALVERPPSETPRLRLFTAVPVATRTNLEEAISLGLALFPADAQKRLVLLSDGGENAGDAMAAGRLAAARGVPIDVVDLGTATGDPEALVARLEAPARARDGQEVVLEAVVSSTVAQSARLTLEGDGGPITTREVALRPGENRVAFTLRIAGDGFQRYSVRLAAGTDGQVVNNTAAALVQVQGPPRVLLVAPDPAEARPLAEALRATAMRPEVVAPEVMPDTLASLGAYEAVVLVNAPARSLPVGAMAALPAYVRDLGKGLLMVGGDQSFGVGGYGRTPVEEALPVSMDVRNHEERPNLAIIFVIDKSGSMDACHCAGPAGNATRPETSAERKVDIAKEAVAGAAGLLGERDTLGVITFDRQPYDTFPATRGATVAAVAAALEPIRPRGSTNVRRALLAAGDMLGPVDAKIKHVILLTDGWGTGGDNMDVAAGLRDRGVTLSVVAAGGGSADYLRELALAGGGRHYDVAQMADVPQIFIEETVTTVGTYVVERPVAPVVVPGSPVMAGIGAMPKLYGFNGSTPRASARRVLLSDDGQPLLVTWQYGLGRSAAWTSDLKGQWAGDWMRWGEFPRFASQLVGWVLPARGGERTTAEVRVDGGTTMVRLSLGADTVAPAEPMVVTARLIAADGVGPALALRQTGPDSYEGGLSSPAPGTYVVQVAGLSGDRVLVQETAGIVIPYPAEYSGDQRDPALLARLATLTGGAPLVSGAEAFAPTGAAAARTSEVGLPLIALALALLPLDILVRRVATSRRRR